MTLAYVGIGSNLDDPITHVSRAFEELAQLPRTRLVNRSSLYRSAPQGFTEQPAFVNAVAALESSLSAEQMLKELQRIEARHGRRRSFPDAPRTLDLDLLLYGTEILRSENLTLPHPRLHKRAFVLKPLLEIAPALEIPGIGPLGACAKACAAQAIERIDG